MSNRERSFRRGSYWKEKKYPRRNHSLVRGNLLQTAAIEIFREKKLKRGRRKGLTWKATLLAKERGGVNHSEVTLAGERGRGRGRK